MSRESPTAQQYQQPQRQQQQQRQQEDEEPAPADRQGGFLGGIFAKRGRAKVGTDTPG